MRIFRAVSQTSNDRPAWLVTFIDLVALLIAFFVMLFATQQIVSTKWAALVESLSRSLNPGQERWVERRHAERNTGVLLIRGSVDLSYLETVLRDRVQADPELKGVLLHRYEDRLVIALSADKLFPAGGATPSRGARRTLYALAGLLRNVTNRIEVYGHTDPRPVSSSLYRSNWELSLARAATVAEVLHRAGFHNNLTALGYADTRFSDLHSVQSRQKALQLARRVDVVVQRRRREDP